MTDQERDGFDRAILGVAEMYNRVLSTQAVDGYWMVLKKLSWDEFNEALGRHLEDEERGKHMPVPADIVHQKKKASPAAWREAWQLVIRTMEDYGAYESILFTDGVLNATVRHMGGWPELCRADLDTPWTERRFREIYEEFSGSGTSTHRHLPGIFEHENRKEGHTVQPPTVIGDRKLLPPSALESQTTSPMVKLLTERLLQ